LNNTLGKHSFDPAGHVMVRVKDWFWTAMVSQSLAPMEYASEQTSVLFKFSNCWVFKE
jgi:hypothetical protein